jgi:hypothetical protein
MNAVCAHPPCSCQNSEGEEYCSEECANVITAPVGKCRCGHDGCEGYLKYRDAQT